MLDLPNYGWLQTNFDDIYGLSMGMGFNLNKKMSLGYLMEKNVAKKNTDLGWNHEVSLAYTFSKNADSEDWTNNSTIFRPNCFHSSTLFHHFSEEVRHNSYDRLVITFLITLNHLGRVEGF